ncbi:MAG: hypothetical protein R3C49_08670 [Planctomycetaceae bacterium]
MTADSIEPFEILRQVSSCETHDVFDAVTRDGSPIRLVKMSTELSELADFRAAFRKDEATLAHLEHHGLSDFLGWADDEDRLTWWTDQPPGTGAVRTTGWRLDTDLGRVH